MDNQEISITKLESELVLNCLDFDILIVSRDYKIFFANSSFLNKIGMKKEEAIGRHCYEITHHLDSPCKPPQDPCPIQKVIETGNSAIEVHTHISKDNKKFFVNVTAAPILDEEKEIGFLHIALPVKEGVNRSDDMKDAMEKTLAVLKIVNLYQRRVHDLETKTGELEKIKKELESKVNDLEKFSKLVVGRELKMIELKDRIKELESEFIKNLENEKKPN